MKLLLTDEELWRAIAKNTDSLSEFIDHQLETGAGTSAQTVDNLQRQYQVYTAELRRRYS